MQNRKPTEHTHDEMSMYQFRQLTKTHNELHNAEVMVKLEEMVNGQSMETEFTKAILGVNLDLVHEEINHHAPEMAEQSTRIVNNLKSKLNDSGDVIAAKNAAREERSVALKVGFFAQQASARRDNADLSSTESDELSVSPCRSPSM